MPTFEDIGSLAAAGDEAVADQGGDSSADPVYLALSKAQSDALARSMKPKVSGNDADDEASDDSRSGFDSHDSRDYASDSPGDVSLNAAPPKAAPDLVQEFDLVQELARFVAQAMKFDDCMLDAMASAPPAEALKVETHTDAQVDAAMASALQAKALKVETHAEAQGSVEKDLTQ